MVSGDGRFRSIKVYKITHKLSSVKYSTFLKYSTHGRTKGDSLKLNKKRARLDLRQHFFTNKTVNIWNHLDNMCLYVFHHWSVSWNIWIYFTQMGHSVSRLCQSDWPKRPSQYSSGAALSCKLSSKAVTVVCRPPGVRDVSCQEASKQAKENLKKKNSSCPLLNKYGHNTVEVQLSCVVSVSRVSGRMSYRTSWWHVFSKSNLRFKSMKVLMLPVLHLLVYVRYCWAGEALEDFVLKGTFQCCLHFHFTVWTGMDTVHWRCSRYDWMEVGSSQMGKTRSTTHYSNPLHDSPWNLGCKLHEWKSC